MNEIEDNYEIQFNTVNKILLSACDTLGCTKEDLVKVIREILETNDLLRGASQAYKDVIDSFIKEKY